MDRPAAAGAPLVRSTRLFDIYKPSSPGSEIAAGHRSLAFRLELRDDGRGDRLELPGVAGEEMELVQPEQALQLADRILVIVDSDVDEPVVRAQIAGVLSHHQQRGGLHPALVPAGAAQSPASE